MVTKSEQDVGQPYSGILYPLSSFEPVGATSELLRDVDAAIADLDSHRPLPPEIAQRLTEDLVIDRVYSSAVLEGGRLSRRETIAALQMGLLDAGTRKDEADVVRLGKAVLALDELVRAEMPMNEGVFRELHRIVVEGMEACEPGLYRSDDVRISGADTVPPSHMDVRDLMRFVATTIRDNLDQAHPVVLAAWSHWAITRIHPFRDGNGRVSRLVQDFVLLHRHYLPVPLYAEDREGQYYQALESADQLDAQPLVELLSKNLLRVTDRFLSAIREDQATADWIGEAAKAASDRTRDTDHRKFLVWDRRVRQLRDEFENIAAQLTEKIIGLTVKIPHYEGVTMDKYRQLRGGQRAERTWIFAIDVKYQEERLRLMVWAGFPQKRWSNMPQDDPVLLLSIEDHPEPGAKPYYSLLDETNEAIITLRQINVSRDGFWRRRWDSVNESDVIDEEPCSSTEVARGLFQEILRRLYVT